jgi:hypothetical protein
MIFIQLGYQILSLDISTIKLYIEIALKKSPAPAKPTSTYCISFYAQLYSSKLQDFSFLLYLVEKR